MDWITSMFYMFLFLNVFLLYEFIIIYDHHHNAYLLLGGEW